jgi:putative (di)nucleoside polyphosphate hydrolase
MVRHCYNRLSCVMLWGLIMIDEKGYRANVGIILSNAQGQVFWGHRPGYGAEGWQFPQGGIVAGETPLEAMYRELYEEVGLAREDVKVLGQTQDWLVYEFGTTKHTLTGKSYIGQKQQWFLLQLVTDESHICLTCGQEVPEFDAWHWVDYWYPAANVVLFKKEVYQQALHMLSPFIK